MEIKCGLFDIAVHLLCEIVQHCNVHDTLQCVARNIALCCTPYYSNCQFLVPFIIEIDTRPDKGFIPTQEQLDWWRNISTLAGVPSNRRGSHRRAEESVKIRREYRNLTKYNCLLIMSYIYE